MYINLNMKKTNIYHVIWDNGEPWAEDRDEKHEVIAANSKEEAESKMWLDDFDRKRGSTEANLIFENVIISE